MIYYYFLKEWSIDVYAYSPDDYDIVYPSNNYLGDFGTIIKANDKIYVIVDYAEEVVE